MTVNDTINALVERARAGEHDAWNELVKRFRPKVFATVLDRLHDLAETDDVTQDVFLNAFRKLGQLREARGFVRWLIRMAGRLALNRLRRRRNVQSYDEDGPVAVPSPAPGPVEVLVEMERRDRLHRGLRRLRPMDRQTLLAFYFAQWSLKEIGEKEKVSPDTIKSRLHLARRHLRQALEGPGFAC